MKKIVSINKLTNNKFLNLYKITYLIDGKNFDYFLASRRQLDKLECNSLSTDAVRALPYVEKNGKIYVILIKEFRYALNNYIYSLPAGLVDKGESTRLAIIRELKEEIGAKVLSLKKVLGSSYSSAGLTDDTLECFYAKVDLAYNQKLDTNESISFQAVELDKLPQFVKTHKFCLPSALMLKNFYLETKLKQAGIQK